MSYPIHMDTMLLELADFCNLRCIMCDMSQAGRRRHGHLHPEKPIHTTLGKVLPFSSFKGIIDSINSSGMQIGILSLFWLGEPMLNPEIDRMLTYLNANMKNIGGWMLHTNGQIMNESTLKLIFQSPGNNTLHFSIDAATPEVYAKVRKGGDFRKLITNIQRVLDHCKSYSKDNLKLVLQFIVMDENRQDAKPFVGFWSCEFRKRGLPFAVARSYAQHRQNTIFLRQEITSPTKQHTADALHKQVCDELGVRE